jgi:DNA-binding FrmR family transcriptional regulator
MNERTVGSMAKEPQLSADLSRRLRTASGHLVAVTRMVDEGAYCIDILKQISAVQSSLSKVAHALSTAHMKHCVREAIQRDGGEERIDELMEALRYLKHF